MFGIGLWRAAGVCIRGGPRLRRAACVRNFVSADSQNIITSGFAFILGSFWRGGPSKPTAWGADPVTSVVMCAVGGVSRVGRGAQQPTAVPRA